MLWLILVAAVILIMLLFPVNVNAKYVYSSEKKQNIFEVRVFGITVFKSGAGKKTKKEKNDKPEEEKKFSFEDFKSIADKWENDADGDIKKRVGAIFKSLKRLADLRKAVCNFEFGFGDAAVTGIGAGIAYGLVYNIFAKLYYYFDIKKKNINVNVTPDFTKEKLCLYLEFGFNVRLIFAILTVIDVIRVYFKLRPEKNV